MKISILNYIAIINKGIIKFSFNMRTHLIIAIIFCFTTQVVLAQTSTCDTCCLKRNMPHVKLTLDLCNPCCPMGFYQGCTGNICERSKPRRLRYVKNKETVSFEVVNINPFRNKVEINSNLISLNMDDTRFNQVMAPILKDTAKDENARLEQIKSLPTDPQNNHSFVYKVGSLKKFLYLIDLGKRIDAFIAQKSNEPCSGNRDQDQDSLKQFAKDFLAIDELVDAWKEKGFSKKLLQSNDSLRNKISVYFTEDSLKNDSIVLLQLNENGKKAISSIRDKLQLLNNLSRSVWTLPKQVRGTNADFVRFDVKIYDLSATPKLLDSMNYKIYIYGGWKFDYSTGFFMSQIKDQEYISVDTLLPGDSISSKRLLKKDNGKYALYTGALLHTNIRMPFGFNMGLSFGGAVNTNSKFIILTGGSVLLNYFPRLCINAGFSWGNMKTLDPSYHEGGIYKTLPSDPATVEKFTGRLYWGLTYNLKK